jgi:acyl-CoA reductase-like NAD-dependent aldehyde dehydrogenase
MSKYALIINGERCTSASNFPVHNPSTEEVIGYSPNASVEQLDEAVVAARNAFKSWSQVVDSERKAACYRIADIIEANAAELAQLLTKEQGKPLKGAGSEFEVGGCIGWTRYTAELELPVEVLEDTDVQRVELHRKPLGVCASITPWNWPLMIAIWHIVPAIRSGNTVLIKPSPYTPLSTLRMIELIASVLPAGVVNAVAGEDHLGALISEHPGIDKIIFTGSTPTGKKVMSNAAGNLKHLTLELGGNDAGIVLPGADPSVIAEGLFWTAFINNGQTCAALKRLYVHDSIYDQVCSALAEIAQSVRVGDGLDESNVLGPIQNAVQYQKVSALVDDAKRSGARILCGGEPQAGNGYFYPPTIVADIKDGTRLVDEEQFGPVLPVIRYSDVEQALASANASELGLGGSVWGDPAIAAELAKRMQCGTVWINNHAAIQPNVPFGGVKNSGIGVEFGVEGLKAYTSIQSLFITK